MFVALPCFGCASGATAREQLRSPNAFERAAAAVRSAEAGDAGAVHTLVDLLEDRDGGVRLYAIVALERLTGKTYSYQHFASEPQRDAAVARWRDALRDGQVSLIQSKPLSPHPVRSGGANGAAAAGESGRGAP